MRAMGILWSVKQSSSCGSPPVDPSMTRMTLKELGVDGREKAQVKPNPGSPPFRTVIYVVPATPLHLRPDRDRDRHSYVTRCSKRY